MKKFERLNKLTNEKELFISCLGTLISIDGEPRLNKVSKKPYFRFTAELQTPNGLTLIGGQVYEALIPYLGKTPEIGDKLDFNCKVSDITGTGDTAGTNLRWGIGGSSYKSITFKNFYPSGLIKERGNLIKGIKIGLWEFFLETGQLYSKIHYQNNIKIGDYEYYYPNGKLKEKGTYNENSRNEGFVEIFHSDGTLKEKSNYRDGDVIHKHNPSEIYNSNIYSMTYDMLLTHTFSSFIREFGTRKYERILEKVSSSKKINNFISDSIRKKTPPHFDYIIQMLNEIPFFIFSRGQTLVVGCLMALQKWDKEVNKRNILLSDEDLRARALYIITECKSMFF
jgi:hypothetical protein